MSVRRAALTAWILFLLAVVGVWLEVRGIDLKYDLADRARRVDAAGLNRRALRAELEAARRPESLERRAVALERRPGGAAPRRR